MRHECPPLPSSCTMRLVLKSNSCCALRSDDCQGAMSESAHVICQPVLIPTHHIWTFCHSPWHPTPKASPIKPCRAQGSCYAQGLLTLMRFRQGGIWSCSSINNTGSRLVRVDILLGLSAKKMGSNLGNHRGHLIQVMYKV